MTTAIEVLGIQDLPDGPGPLAEADRGKGLVWDGSRFVAETPAPGAAGPAQVYVTGGRGGQSSGTSTIAGATDFGGTAGAGTDGYAIVWDDGAGEFTLAEFEAAGAAAAAVASHVAEGDPHTQYLLASGSRAGASAGLQTLTSGIVTPIIRPASDSTTAVRVQNAAGSTSVLTVDTTNNLVLFPEKSFGAYPSFGNASSSARGFQFDGAYLRYVTSPTEFEVQFGLNQLLLGTSIIGWTTSAAAPLGAVRRAIAPLLNEQGVMVRSIQTPSARQQAFHVAKSYTDESNMEVGVISWNEVTDVCVIGALGRGTGTQRETRLIGSFVTALQSNSTTNTVENVLHVRKNSTGTPAAGFGGAIRFGMKSSTTDNQDAGRLSWEWITATHASRASRGKLSAYYTSTERIPIQWEADASGTLVGFHGTAPIAKPTITGSRGGNAALASLLTALANYGIIVDSSS